jgi:diguanylate cyclase (GGDEF)-like protein
MGNTMTMASVRAIPEAEDAAALVQRYQQRIRSELLKKVVEEETRAPRWRRVPVTRAADIKGGSLPVRERIVLVAQTFSQPQQFVASGLALALSAAATSACILLGSPGLLPVAVLAGLATIVVLGVVRPVRWVVLSVTAFTAILQAALATVNAEITLAPGLAAALGLVATAFVADRYGLACRREQHDRERARRLIDDMQPVDQESGVLKWPHASLVFDRELARAHRYGYPLCLLRVSIDHWESSRINLGPERAGAALGEVGKLLVKSSRIVDVVAYHGDGQFDLLLPDTPDLGAVVVARRIGDHQSAYPGIQVRAGVAPVTKREGSIDDLLNEAELAVATARKLNRTYAVYGVTKAVATTKALAQAAARA